MNTIKGVESLEGVSKTAGNEELLDRVENDLIDRGVLKPGEMQTWHFDELYHANPEDLPSDMRQLQIEAWNSPECEHLRKRFNLPLKGV